MADTVQQNTNDVAPTESSKYKSIQYPLRDAETVGNWIHFDRVKYSRDGILDTSKLVPAENASTVVLPLPAQLSQTYRAQWDENNLDIFGEERIKSMGGALTAGLKAHQRGDFQPITEAYNNGVIGNALRDMGKAMLVDIATDNRMFADAGLAIGLARNPYKAVYFTTPNFRIFPMEYRLVARNLQEANMIRRIVREFKVGMAPSFNNDLGANNLYNYPDLFMLSIQKKEHLFDFAPCVLRECTVDYHAEGSAVYFDDGSGVKVPASVRLVLEFQETKVLTREDFTGANGNF